MLATASLVAAAAIWGSTFIIVKEALADIPTFEFLAIRFTIASVVMCAVWFRSVPSLWRVGLGPGVLAGAFLAGGHAFQTVGLEITSAANAGFITGLYVLFTPLLAAFLLRRKPARWPVVGALIATVGLGLMSLRLADGRVTAGYGDVLILICAVLYAGQIVVLGRYAPTADTRVLTLHQLIVTALVFAALTPTTEVVAPVTGRVWLAILLTALGASAFGIGVQTWAQRSVTPTRAAVIFSLEAPFAALFGYLLGGERISSRAAVGAALILVGIWVALRDSGLSSAEQPDSVRFATQGDP